MADDTKKSLNKIARKKAQMRGRLWPDLDESQLWERKTSAGWLSMPRAMPLILRIMDTLAPKGKPVSQTYLDLWCRTYDDSFVIVSKPREMAYHSGFSGERAESTWATRMRTLRDLGFIDIKEGVSPINYALLYNPYYVIKKHYQEKRLSDAEFTALQQRLLDIGADDLDD